MSPLGKFALRLGLYGLVVAYIAGDLFVFHGPLWRRIERSNPGSEASLAAARNQGVVARVFNHKITRGQLERATHERLWLSGKNPATLTPGALKTARYAALDDLLDHELLRIKAKAHAASLIVSEEEIDERLRRMLGRFETKGAMEKAMISQGIPSEQDLRDRIAARIQQEKYVELKIAPLVAVTDEEARHWFDENRKHLTNPERIQLRHIFLPTLDQTPDAAKRKLEEALADLLAGKKDFATLARELSEDPATRESGGELGWSTRNRLPADFAKAVFTLPASKPTLVRSKIGWHLVEVTARKPAATPTFEEEKTGIIAALEAAKRSQATHDFRAGLRRMEAGKIDVFHDVIAR